MFIAFDVIPLTVLGDLVLDIFLPETQTLCIQYMWVEGSKERLDNGIQELLEEIH